MNIISYGLSLSVSVSYFDCNNKIALHCQTSVIDVHNYEKHLVNGRLHKTDGPAYIEYVEESPIKKSGRKRKRVEQYREKHYYNKQYYNNGKLHRTDGPAIVSHDFSGKKMIKCSEEYFIDNDIHKT